MALTTQGQVEASIDEGIVTINFFIYCSRYIIAGVPKKMKILTCIIVLLIGAGVGYFLGNTGILGMIAGAIAATLIFYDLNRKSRTKTSDIGDKIE